MFHTTLDTLIGYSTQVSIYSSYILPHFVLKFYCFKGFFIAKAFQKNIFKASNYFQRDNPVSKLNLRLKLVHSSRKVLGIMPECVKRFFGQ